MSLKLSNRHEQWSVHTPSSGIDDIPLIIGERINPTGKNFKAALKEKNLDYIVSEAFSERKRALLM